MGRVFGHRESLLTMSYKPHTALGRNQQRNPHEDVPRHFGRKRTDHTDKGMSWGFPDTISVTGGRGWDADKSAVLALHPPDTTPSPTSVHPHSILHLWGNQAVTDLADVSVKLIRVLGIVACAGGQLKRMRSLVWALYRIRRRGRWLWWCMVAM